MPLKSCTKVLKALLSVKLPLLLSVPPLNKMALVLAAVLPPQVVAPASTSVRPPVRSLRPLPLISVAPSKRCVPAPLMSPPVQLVAPVTVSAPVPIKLPLLWL